MPQKLTFVKKFAKDLRKEYPDKTVEILPVRTITANEINILKDKCPENNVVLISKNQYTRSMSLFQDDSKIVCMIYRNHITVVNKEFNIKYISYGGV